MVRNRERALSESPGPDAEIQQREEDKKELSGSPGPRKDLKWELKLMERVKRETSRRRRKAEEPSP